MDQKQRREYLINELIKENPEYRDMVIFDDVVYQKRLLRSLMNVRKAGPISEEFERIQDEYLLKENSDRGIVKITELSESQPDIYIWQGDITRLSVDAIVNAANSGMTGCYQPCHNCIDKAPPTSITQVYNKRMARCS